MLETSTLRSLYEDEVLHLGLNPALSLLQLTWKQHPASETYRRGYHQAILLALEHKAKYWLTDARQLPYLHQADQHWMYAKMRPLLKAGKLRRMALVLQPEALIMADQKPLLETTELPFQAKKLFSLDFFLDVDSALSWLQEEDSN